MEHAGASGTQHGKNKDDPNFYESNSGIPILPSISGFMGTHGTYRFLTIHEQTAILIGDGKHGIWRIQENGMIRNYRKKGMVGIKEDTDPNDLNPNSSDDKMKLDIINKNYAEFIPEESWSGYKYSDEKLSEEGYLNFIDLTIYHPKYEGKYNDHEPIDLPHWFCTMSQARYPNVWNAWKYATAQNGANKPGPLAIRAGFDIKENYHNILRFNFIGDAGIWSNVGVGAESDKIATTLNQIKDHVQTINYQRVDMSKVDAELYLFERPFFNVPYIFISMVMDTKVPSKEYSYVRPHGPYYNELLKRNKRPKNTVVKHYPPVWIEGNKEKQTTFGLPVYGHHHPARHQHKLTGGACPNRGGDWGRYPWSLGGSGFPTNYEEISPLCDGMVVDMKMWYDLDKSR